MIDSGSIENPSLVLEGKIRVFQLVEKAHALGREPHLYYNVKKKYIFMYLNGIIPLGIGSQRITSSHSQSRKKRTSIHNVSFSFPIILFLVSTLVSIIYTDPCMHKDRILKDFFFEESWHYNLPCILVPSLLE